MRSDIRPDNTPPGKILKLLQQQGPCSSRDIEAALGVTRTAVQQLTPWSSPSIATRTMGWRGNTARSVPWKRRPWPWRHR
jgi:hypothetical protein